MHHISGYLFPDFPKHLHVLHVEQEVVGDDTKVIDFVMKSDKERTMLLKRQADLEHRRENDPDFDADHEIDVVRQCVCVCVCVCACVCVYVCVCQ